jgi:P-type conjugative transfer protein TrbG
MINAILNRAWLLGGALGTLLLVGCAGKPSAPPRYFQAQQVPQPERPPAVVTVPEPMPLPGQMRPTPPPNPSPRARADDPCITEVPDRGDAKKIKNNHRNCNDVASVIAEANKRSAQSPNKNGYFNAIQTYSYDPGAIYQIYTVPLRVTVLSMQPGEKVIGKPVAGDAARWFLAFGSSMKDKVEQTLIYLRPYGPGQDTSMVISTDRRVYFLEIHSFEGPDSYMAGVSWRYPDDEIRELEVAAANTAAREATVTAKLNRDLSSSNFQYKITVKRGRPSWTPEMVFDDGRKTYIKFPSSVLVREAPAFFVRQGDADQIVAYIVRNDCYIVDMLFDVAELRLGQDKPDIVQIRRK